MGINDFLEIQNKSNRVASNIFGKLCDLGYRDDFLDICQDSSEIEQIILELHPTSMRSITTICSLFSSYSKFIGNIDAYNKILKIDRKQVWNKVKNHVQPKYISYSTYTNVLDEIFLVDEYNYLYYKTLFCVIYEGIYCDDMSVITNLRVSDISGNIVTLHKSDGYSYKIVLSDELINNLKELADDCFWFRRNAQSMCKISMFGKYENSCFKKEYRKGGDDAYSSFRYVYYNKLRNITKECLGYKITPSQLFVSGIMHRICLELENHNISISDAFSEHSRNVIVKKIIEKELSRCEYDIPVRAFRELVENNLEIFEKI